eukprot:5785277-Ditylum_brightwellii.AAC.1
MRRTITCVSDMPRRSAVFLVYLEECYGDQVLSQALCDDFKESLWRDKEVENAKGNKDALISDYHINENLKLMNDDSNFTVFLEEFDMKTKEPIECLFGKFVTMS